MIYRWMKECVKTEDSTCVCWMDTTECGPSVPVHVDRRWEGKIMEQAHEDEEWCAAVARFIS